MITLTKLDAANWLEVSRLSVGEEQKVFFPISNIYWIAISRYEEMTELYAIKNDDEIVGLIGGGLDEDQKAGYINPIMIDKAHQRHGYAKEAMLLMIELLYDKFKTPQINLGHRKTNTVAGKMYESLGFLVIGEDEKQYFRSLVMPVN